MDKLKEMIKTIMSELLEDFQVDETTVANTTSNIAGFDGPLGSTKLKGKLSKPEEEDEEDEK